jgi:hypothetical protein
MGGSGGDFGLHDAAIIREVSAETLSADLPMAEIDDIVLPRHWLSIEADDLF